MCVCAGVCLLFKKLGLKLGLLQATLFISVWTLDISYQA